MLPVKGAVMGVGALGHGAMAGASAIGKGVKFEVHFGSTTPAKGYNMDNFVLTNMDEYASGRGLRDGVPPSSSPDDGHGVTHDTSFDEVVLESPAGVLNGPAQAPASGDAPMRLGLHAPRAPSNVLTELDWCLSSQTMELLCLSVLESTKMQARGHALLRKTLDGFVPLQVPDALLAVYQTRMILSIVRFLMAETDRELIIGNTKLAINMCKLAGYAVDKMYTGWLLAGHEDILRYCVHVIAMVESHSVYWNLYRGVAASVWRAALYILTVGKGEALSSVLDYISENYDLVFNSTGMDAVMCSQAFKALADILLTLGQSHKDYSALAQRAARLTGQLLSVSSAHTRQVIIGLLVYKPSLTAKLFRKGEKDKAIDLMSNGFDKLCGSESVSTLNPLRSWWKAGDHLVEFRAWALEPQTRGVITARLAQSLVTASKEFHERCHRLSREDVCPFGVRWNKDRANAKRELLANRQLLSSILKRNVCFPTCLHAIMLSRRSLMCISTHEQEHACNFNSAECIMITKNEHRLQSNILRALGFFRHHAHVGSCLAQEVFDHDLEAFRRDRKLDAHRRVLRQRIAQFWWLVSRRLLEGPAGVWQASASRTEHRGQWMMDSFLDALHTRRRRVPVTFIHAPSREGYRFLRYSPVLNFHSSAQHRF